MYVNVRALLFYVLQTFTCKEVLSHVQTSNTCMPGHIVEAIIRVVALWRCIPRTHVFSLKITLIFLFSIVAQRPVIVIVS